MLLLDFLWSEFGRDQHSPVGWAQPGLGSLGMTYSTIPPGAPSLNPRSHRFMGFCYICLNSGPISS